MSCYVINYKDGAKMMRPVQTREEYLQLRNSSAQVMLVRQVRSGNGNAKMRLLQMNYSCIPGEDGKLKGCTMASDTVGMDVDILRNENEDENEYQARLADIPEKVLAKKNELGLLMLERSASKGFHLVFKRRETLGQEDNLRWASELLGVKYDEGAKDITRVFFTTTGSDDDLLFLDDELFVGKPATQMPETAVGDSDRCDAREPITAQPAERSADYDGIPYSAIVEALENQLGGIPAHGSRNQFIFSMACHLRYVCNDDPQWIADVLPTYGEGHEKWLNTIRSACNRSQNKMMPKLLKTAVEQARLQHVSDAEMEAEDVEGTDGSGNGTCHLRCRRSCRHW